MKITSNEAFELSKGFRKLSVELGDYRFDQWNNLTPSQRQKIENDEWTLLNASSDMITMAVGLVLDETVVRFNELKKSTLEAKKAVKKLKEIKKIIKITTAAVQLAGAIVSKDLGAIAKRTKGLFEAATA